MDERMSDSIEMLVRRVQQRELTRAGFVSLLAAMGASTTGIATLLASPDNASAAILPPRRALGHIHTQHHNKQRHEAHVRRQGAATHGARTDDRLTESQMQHLQIMVDDYAPNAVVEDPLFAEPIVGRDAIAARKAAEMRGMRGVTIEVTHRFAHRDQVVAEWVLQGVHEGEVFGYPATGRRIEVRGVTIVTRTNGKITRESLHYDVADVHRQLSL